MILAIIQARFSSSRFLGKVLKTVLDKPMLLRQIERISRSKKITKMLVATSTDCSDDQIEEVCRTNNIECFRGDLNDVLDRYYQAAKLYGPAHIVRLTGDCPLIDPDIIDKVISYHVEGDYDYTSNTIEITFPDGLDVEVMKVSALETAWRKAILPSHREHVTRFIYTQPGIYKLGVFRNDVDLGELRWTVDKQEDFELISTIYKLLYSSKPDFDFKDILQCLEAHPELKTVNSNIQRNVGIKTSLLADEKFLQRNPMKTKDRYSQSQMLLERALQSIPLGSQTFSKSITQYPLGVSPHFLKKGLGSHVWDVDDNEYIDFINSLAAINLGYNDPDVNEAVKKQLELGVSFSLSHPIETLVAEKIIEMVPCAERVRFGKNGSDATAGAVRLARAYTGREHVAVCGYHGWQDWYIGSTSRNLGVPKSTQELTHTFNYNDLESLGAIFDKWPNQIAAVILEPMNVVYPAEGFLLGVQELTQKNNAILIFDEIVTGFRFANGGAQEYFGVTPDLATFGKGIANGYPLAVITGRKEIMALMEEIFFSFTFGGETLSLAAALATLNKLQNQPVLAKLKALGEMLMAGIKQIIQKYHLSDIFDVSGHPAWNFLIIKGTEFYQQNEIKTLWLQEIFSKGILSLGSHNLSYAHSEEDIKQLLCVYEEVLPFITQAVIKREIHSHLRCKPLQALFKVR